ncbi:thiamine-phosphate kinase [Sphingomonas solaris]|uniref:Thiamine-monophosphate kinase n=1 Tax=Alterirhizorhabdus solaris TaxID=2529389 RepID=A0A558QUM4_9SPHN|nr:thiamine-phosphate kinase [Sphingomonas solaris]TVV70861.1 thiamine-phosphate kinase [Sphingomonas solaris]
MTHEAAFIAALRALATDPAARGLRDDAAVLPVAAGDLVLTHDMLVEGVHFLPDDPPGDVAWKLVAVNLSDLAAKGAAPLGLLMGCGLAGGGPDGDDTWDAGFVAGLGATLAAFAVPLLGGDTVRMPPGGPRTLGLTAIGRAPACGAPIRGGARAGDVLWASGTIGDAGAGLAIARAGRGDATLRDRYRRPAPRLAAGIALAPHVTAMADISDGLLIDAGRMAEASGLRAAIDLDAVPLSPALAAWGGQDRAARLAAATAGDDYELLFAAPPSATATLLALRQPLALNLTPIGWFEAGTGLALTDRAGAMPLPERLGYEHGA